MYNLCSERSYDHSHFHSRVECFGFDDHNAPSLDLMTGFCESAHAWLSAHVDNVIVVHCKAGKGRTGVMICAYLMYCGMWATSEDSLQFYASARTQNSKGVTIPSQVRYVYYYEQVLHAGLRDEKRLKVRRVSLTPHPHASWKDPVVRILATHQRKEVYVTRDVIIDKEGLHFDFPNVDVTGDVKVEVLRTKRFGKLKLMMGAWFNTRFVEDNYCIFPRSQLDSAYKKKADKLYSDHFALEIFFEGYDDQAMERTDDGQKLVVVASTAGRYDVATHGRRSVFSRDAQEERKRVEQVDDSDESDSSKDGDD